MLVQIPHNITVSMCKFINLTYLSDLLVTSEEKWKNIYLLYKSISLVPKIEITNISASICLICMIMGSIDLSELELSKSGEKMVISITNQQFLLSRSTLGQRKMLFKKLLNVLVLPAHGYG